MHKVTDNKINIISVEDLTQEELEICIEKNLCINCKEPAVPKCYSRAGIKEYQISGLCEPCFDAIVGEDE